jgi:hypothetical protein
MMPKIIPIGIALYIVALVYGDPKRSPKLGAAKSSFHDPFAHA